MSCEVTGNPTLAVVPFSRLLLGFSRSCFAISAVLPRVRRIVVPTLLHANQHRGPFRLFSSGNLCWLLHRYHAERCSTLICLHACPHGDGVVVGGGNGGGCRGTIQDSSTQGLKVTALNSKMETVYHSAINFDTALPHYGTDGGFHQGGT
jgi:hypothetical protein